MPSCASFPLPIIAILSFLTLTLYPSVLGTFSCPSALHQASELPPLPSPLPSLFLSFRSPFSSAGRHDPLPRGYGNEKVDVIVVGSGVSGVEVVRNLVEMYGKIGEKVRIVVLEARDFASGATGRTGGLLTNDVGLTHPFSSPSEAFSSLSASLLSSHSASSTLSLIRTSNWTLDVDLVEGGSVRYDVEVEGGQAGFGTKKRLERAFGAGVELDGWRWIKKDDADRAYGSTNLGDAVYIPSATVRPPPSVQTPQKPTLTPTAWTQVNQPKLASKLFALAKSEADRHGIRLDLFTYHPVQAVVQADEGKWDVVTRRGNITSEIIVHATNAYASRLLPSYSASSSSSPQRSISALRTQSLAIRPPPLVHPRWSTSFVVPPRKDSVVQLPERTEDQGRPPLIIVSSTTASSHPLSRGEGLNQLWMTDDGKTDPAEEDRLGKMVPEKFGGHWRNAFVDVEASWTAVVASTPDGAPVVGPVVDCNGSVVQGQFITAGFDGRSGLSRAPACAQVVAQMVVDHRRGQVDTPVLPDWMPKHYLSTR